MNVNERNKLNRIKRKKRIRGKIWGTALKPRLTVFKSLNHIYAQVINDEEGKTLTSMSTVDKELKTQIKSGGNIEASKKVGELLAKKAKLAGITEVAFDRNGYIYHGRIKSLADGAREKGLKF